MCFFKSNFVEYLESLDGGIESPEAKVKWTHMHPYVSMTLLGSLLPLFFSSNLCDITYAWTLNAIKGRFQQITINDDDL